MERPSRTGVFVSTRSPLRRRSALPRSQLYMDVLFLGEPQHLFETFLAPEPRLLDAPEGRAEEMLADFVDPDIAGLHGHRRAVRGRQIVSPDRACQAVFDAVDR